MPTQEWYEAGRDEVVETIEVGAIVEVFVDETGNWDWLDQSFNWSRSPDSPSGDWYYDIWGHSESLVIDDEVGVTEKVGDLLDQYIPLDTTGVKYLVSFNASLVYWINPIWNEMTDSPGQARYLPDQSSVEILSIT